ncbi:MULTISPECIES: hypothetical protein [unclassified Moraxella]|uniref:hypothetical protein n=1 Tax=unclassified Moraxella TaxID=2685852 RepID=UPI00359E7876
MTVDDEMLLAQPELLARAMLSALVYHQSDGVEILLSIYEAQPQALMGTPIVTWAKATIATKHQDHRTAITLYQNLVKNYPDNQLFKARLAQSLIAHRQYKEAYTIIAADPVLAEQMAPYAKAIDKLTKTNIHIGGSAIVDKNTNKPAQATLAPVVIAVQALPAQAVMPVQRLPNQAVKSLQIPTSHCQAAVAPFMIPVQTPLTQTVIPVQRPPNQAVKPFQIPTSHCQAALAACVMLVQNATSIGLIVSQFL